MSRLLLAAIVGLAAALLVTARAAGLDAAQLRARAAVCQTFGRHCAAAVRVAYCESRLRVDARNGQYLGIFQMGEYARARYGHGPGAWAQARAARRYFLAAGWAPWECKP